MKHTIDRYSTLPNGILNDAAMWFQFNFTCHWQLVEMLVEIGISGSATVAQLFERNQCLICLKVFEYLMQAYGSGSTFFTVNISSDEENQRELAFGHVLMRLKIESQTKVNGRLNDGWISARNMLRCNCTQWPATPTNALCLFILRFDFKTHTRSMFVPATDGLFHSIVGLCNHECWITTKLRPKQRNNKRLSAVCLCKYDRHSSGFRFRCLTIFVLLWMNIQRKQETSHLLTDIFSRSEKLPNFACRSHRVELYDEQCNY